MFLSLYVVCCLCVHVAALLPPVVNPIAVKYVYIISYIVSYHIISYIIAYNIIYHIISYHIISVPIRNFTREAACCLSGIKHLKWCYINTFQATNFQMLFGDWHQQTHLSFVRSRGTPLCCTCLRHCSGVCMRYRTVPLLLLTLKHKVVMSLLI
jgi:hypothetical protein